MLNGRRGVRRKAAALILFVYGIAFPLIAGADEAPIASGTRTNGKAHLDVLSLRRTEGNTVTLRIAVTNEENQPLTIQLSLINLVDLVNHQIYNSGLNSPRCSVPPGERLICWAIFAAPNASVKSVNVTLNEDFGLIPTPIQN
jgi:hypothetical protein